MIKGLPDQWYVYVPTKEVMNMVVKKLENCGFRKHCFNSDEFINFPIFIASLHYNKDTFSNFDFGMNQWNTWLEKTEIPLSMILEASEDEGLSQEELEKIYKDLKVIVDNLREVNKAIIESCETLKRGMKND